jgi:hypothetical protein
MRECGSCSLCCKLLPVRGDEMRALRKLHRVPHRFPPPHPARRRRRQDAIPDPPTHASPCLWVQARQRWPRHAPYSTISGRGAIFEVANEGNQPSLAHAISVVFAVLRLPFAKFVTAITGSC